MFERLIADIRASHVFSEVWPEREWERELPALQQEVSLAAERPALLRALRHLSNSLRDGHLAFTPAGGGDEHRPRMPLPFELVNAGSPELPQFVVARSDRPEEFAPGDELLRYDGVPSGDLLQHFRLELNGATRDVRLQQLLSFLNSRSSVEHGGEENRVALTLRHGASVVETEASFGPPSSPRASAGHEGACPAPPRAYGASYELVEAGANVCLYRASLEPFASYPIVRHFSFLGSRERRLADHERVRAFLAASPHAAGVLLDLRDNGGGAAADYILPWYASGPYRRLSERVRINPMLTDRTRLRRALRNDAAVDEYVRRSVQGERWWVRPFECGSDGCEDSPRPGPVTRAPIALLLGPSCRSACDSFAAIWSREHLGPTLGTPPAAMYTSLRYPLPVQLDDEPLGDFTIALCSVHWEGDAAALEGRSLPIDVEVAPSGSASGSQTALLQSAIAALRNWPGRAAGATTPPH